MQIYGHYIYGSLLYNLKQVIRDYQPNLLYITKLDPSLAGQTAFFPFYIESGKKESGDTPLANLFCSSKIFCYSN